MVEWAAIANVAAGLATQVAQNPWVQQQVSNVITSTGVADIANKVAGDVVGKIIGGVLQPKAPTPAPVVTQAAPVCPVIVVKYDAEVNVFGQAVIKLNDIQNEVETLMGDTQRLPMSSVIDSFKNMKQFEQSVSDLIMMQPGVVDRYRKLMTAFADLQCATKSGKGDANAQVPYSNAIQSVADFTARVVKTQTILDELVAKDIEAKKQQLHVVIFVMLIIAIVAAVVSYLIAKPSKTTTVIINPAKSTNAASSK